MEHNIAQFLAILGERVRDARADKGISRRVLSELSGVSQRYLAQLESGKGNISIGLLLRVADALGASLEELVTQQAGALRAKRIALIGLRGAGKSTLGKLAATGLGVTFLEVNADIERASGMPVHEVFALYGPEGYRRLERQALERIAATQSSLILAVAGGIVSDPETFSFLLLHFHTIWLKAAPEDHMARVQGQGDERPMAGHSDALADLRKILARREALYARADADVDTSGTTPQESLEKLLKTIENNGFLVDF